MHPSDRMERAPPSTRFINATATILAGQSLSSSLDCGPGAPVFIHMPDWTSAPLSFQVSPDGTTFTDLFDRSAAEISFNVVAFTAVLLPIGLAPVLHLKIRSGLREFPVPQQADRIIVVTLDTIPP